MCTSMNNNSNCLHTWTWRTSLVPESIKTGFRKAKPQNMGKLLLHLPLVIRKLEVCLPCSSCLLPGLKLLELSNSQFSSLIRKSNRIVLLACVWMSWDAHMGQTHRSRSMWYYHVASQRPRYFSLKNKPSLLILFLCKHYKDILRLTKSVSTVETNFLGDVFPNLNWRLPPQTSRFSKCRPETTGQLLLQPPLDWISTVVYQLSWTYAENHSQQKEFFTDRKLRKEQCNSYGRPVKLGDICVEERRPVISVRCLEDVSLKG